METGFKCTKTAPTSPEEEMRFLRWAMNMFDAHGVASRKANNILISLLVNSTKHAWLRATLNKQQLQSKTCLGSLAECHIEQATAAENAINRLCCANLKKCTRALQETAHSIIQAARPF